MVDEQGSTADNLSCLEYKIQQDKNRLKEIQEKARAAETEYNAIQPILKTHAKIDEVGKKDADWQSHGVPVGF